MLRHTCLALTMLFAAAPTARAEWHTLAGGNDRRNQCSAGLTLPAGVAWATALDGERIGTAVEPIVAGERVFVPTHAGAVWALDTETGRPVWRFKAAGPVLHSPAFDAGAVFVADAAGCLHAVDARTGTVRWTRAFTGDSFAASPVVYAGKDKVRFVAVGSVGGTAYGVDAETGAVRWRAPLGAPVRQTMAEAAGNLYVTDEAMRVNRVDGSSGRVWWSSEPVVGQSARDYYPVIGWRVDNTRVVAVRTSPRQQFSRRINADLRALCAAAGIDGSDWKAVAAWTKNRDNLGTHERWEAERQAVLNLLGTDPAAATLHLFDAGSGQPVLDATGKPAVPPVLWAGGCQGVPAPPAVLSGAADRFLLEFRTAYGNWSHGVAPLVGLGVYGVGPNALTRLNHSNGTPDAPWNTFWGTADEAKHLQALGASGSAIITHQGTLTLFDGARALAPIQGDRDTFGGYKQGLPWARNEWHGPARGGAAVDGNSLYWISGSRIFRVVCNGEKRPLPKTVVHPPAAAPLATAANVDPVPVAAVKATLDGQVRELMANVWAPFACVPGLAGTERAAAQSGEVVEALAEAYPHLPPDRQPEAAAHVAKVFGAYPPLTEHMTIDPAQGERREDAAVDPEALKPRPDEPRLHPFGNVYAVKRWADRAGDAKLLAQQWPLARRAFESFAKSNWKLDPAKGDLYANRYAASLIAYAEWAAANKDPSAEVAKKLADATTAALAAWWKRAAAEQRAMAGVEGVAQLDGFIGKGGGVFLRLVPHRHKLALFKDLTPAVLAAVRKLEPDAPKQAWDAFVAVAPTWYLVGGERQVHSGENLYDPPDFALDAFRAAKLIGGPKAMLPTYADRPWGRADIYFIHKAAMAAE
ncbi:MAG TPA: PQQ-binding-like beta-propeller repeat protein [Humisphaera sp.]